MSVYMAGKQLLSEGDDTRKLFIYSELSYSGAFKRRFDVLLYFLTVVGIGSRPWTLISDGLDQANRLWG